MGVFYFTRRLILKLACVLLAAVLLIGGGYYVLKKERYQPTLAPIYQGDQGRKEIALTVNVYWGEEYLPQMLKIMEEEKVKATFFIGGMWAEKFPDLLKEIAQQGHDIGSHGYSHPHPDHLNKAGNLREIKRSEKIIKEIIGKDIKLFAPPYGERGNSVLAATEEAGYQLILWSIDTIDWQRPAPDTIVQRVISKAHNGAIVLMHPTAPTVRALPTIIKELKGRGYEFITVTELLENLPQEEEGQLTEETG
ncbi:polysaccharide deacetylase family protein [Desulfofalx alkaliphila]|uniref:polysaccharide deacetylase family protein n=1 Tax=Desulfofalx alkaliphila TaxID=105483 RepID=UPI0004E174D7|nr:polysaccharide deacetylase family protein [Desulfofalx alkaliphila]